MPDSYLTSKGFVDEKTGAAYKPADYPNHGDGLFFVGVEGNGSVYAYALDQNGTDFTKVATIASGFPASWSSPTTPRSRSSGWSATTPARAAAPSST